MFTEPMGLGHSVSTLALLGSGVCTSSAAGLPNIENERSRAHYDSLCTPCSLGHPSPASWLQNRIPVKIRDGIRWKGKSESVCKYQKGSLFRTIGTMLFYTRRHSLEALTFWPSTAPPPQATSLSGQPSSVAGAY